MPNQYWSDAITTALWPYCVSQAINFHNVCYRSGKTDTPWRLYTGEDSPFSMDDFKIWGCPVYVADEAIQDGTNIARWKERARQCVYVGQSTRHANTVYMVWDPVTTHVSPQYHLVFDEKFTTVAPTIKSMDDLSDAIDGVLESNQNVWSYKDDFDDANYFFDESKWENPIVKDLINADKAARDYLNKLKGTKDPVSLHEGDTQEKSPKTSDSTSSVLKTFNKFERHPGLLRHAAAALSNTTKFVSSCGSEERVPVGAGATLQTTVAHTSSVLRQQDTNVRKRKNPPYKLSFLQSSGIDCRDHNANYDEPLNYEFFDDITEEIKETFVKDQQNFESYCDKYSVDPKIRVETHPKQDDAKSKILDAINIASEREKNALQALYTQLYASPNTDDVPDLIDTDYTAYQAMIGNEDTLTQSQMKRASDRAEFEKAQVPEITGLIEADVFKPVPLNTIPKGHRLLNAIWSYRRKRRPDGSLLKYKARLCADGSMQTHGVDYFDTYAPVVQFSTVRLVLCLAAILGLHGRQIDYVQAFTQAELHEDIFMRLPEGWAITDDEGNVQQNMCLKLLKNLYGTKNAARNWYKKLNGALRKLGFTPSKIDPCLYMRNDSLIVLYTDDCLIFTKDEKVRKSLLSSLSEEFILEDEGDIENFLGIHIERDPKNGTIIMTQTGLIDSILDDLGLTSQSTKKYVPATTILHPDPDGAPRKDPWNYRSVIGKLIFLGQMTRPDISMPVHMCARYSNNPKMLHEQAVKYLGRYLLQTRKKGLILSPKNRFSLDAYVDADFAGLWHRNFSAMRDTALSRSGYIIMFCGCPIYWKSKLQSEVALSTCEAEYIALSQCMRELLPMRTILKELRHQLQNFELAPSRAITRSYESFIPKKLPASEIFEDNQSCLILATSEDQYRPRTKHINVKWHHFKDQIFNGQCIIQKNWH